MSVDSEALASIERLANEILRLSEQESSTPVLVLPPSLSLRTPFFVALVETLQRLSKRSLRFDFCFAASSRDDGMTWRDRLDEFSERVRASRLNRRFRSLGAPAPTPGHERKPGMEWVGCLSFDGRPPARVDITATIGRPVGLGGELVIGVSREGSRLPGWATPIHILGVAIGPGLPAGAVA